MKRSLIRQKSAYTITLPIYWIREQRLEKGGEVDITEEKNSLIISTHTSQKKEEIELTLTQEDEHYIRIMIENHYLKGYDIIDVKLKKQNISRIVSKVVSNLIGFEIIEEKNNSLRIVSTTKADVEEFKTLVKRCFNIIKYSSNHIKKDIEKDKFDSYEDIKRYTDDLRKFSLYCTRILHKNLIMDRKEISFFHLLLERLILIQHDLLYFYQKIIEVDFNIKNKKIVKVYFDSLEMFNMFSDMFFNKNLENFGEINKRWEKIYFKESIGLSNNLTQSESIVLYHAQHFSKLVFLISQPNLIYQTIN